MYKILFGLPAMVLPYDMVNEDGYILDYMVEEDSDIWCDFELDYYPDEKCYRFEFETYLGFTKEGGARNWLINCLAGLTQYMEDHNYDITKEINLYEAFTEGVNVNKSFDDIETAYAWLKMMVFGFHGKGAEQY